MANYANIISAIQAVITQNGNNEITGLLLQQTLISVVNSLGANYQFAGIATTATNPGTPDQNVAYIAGPGTYPNFGGTTINDQCIGVFTYNGTWRYVTFDVGEKILTPVDYATNTWYQYRLLATKKWSTTGTQRHIIIPATAGQVYRFVGGSESTSFGFLTSHTSTITGGSDAPVVAGSEIITVPAGGTVDAIVPETTQYICVYSGNTSGGTGREALPAAIYIVTSAMDNLRNSVATLTGNVATLTNEVSGLSQNISFAVPKTLRLYSLTSSGYGSSASYNHAVAQVTPGEKITFVCRGSSGRYAFVTSNDNPVSEGSVPLVSGESIVSITGTVTVTVPEGAKYVLVTNGAISNPGVVVDIYGYAQKLRNDTYSYVDSILLMLASVLAFGKEFNGFDIVTLRDGTITNTGNAQAVSQNAVVAVNGSSKIGIYTDRPLKTGHYYKYFNGTYNRKSGAVNSTNIRQYTGPSGSVVDNVVDMTVLDSAAVGIAFGIVEYDENNAAVNVRKEDWLGYHVWIVRFASADSQDTTSIIALNNDYEWLPKMISAKKRYYTSSNTTQQEPYVIAHLSDIHGNWTNVARFLEFSDHHAARIDMLLNTGDTVTDDFDDGITGYAALEGVGNIINITGNHDTSRYVDNVREWQYYCGLPVYNLLIAPFISNWGVIQPSGAAENGYCYFYKDIAAKKLRIIFVDIMGFNDTQNAWLDSLLDDAITNEYHVLIATHFAGSTGSGHGEDPTFDKIDCNYTSLYSLGSSSSVLNSYNYSAYKMMATVQDFINGGGVFVGYVQGHYHADFIAKVNAYPDQLIYAVGSSKSGEVRDYKHIVGTKMQDEFQIISIDTYLHTIKFYKVGANVDLYGRHKNCICIDYVNRTIKAEAF